MNKKQTRESFWRMMSEEYPHLYKMKRYRNKQNDYNTDIRVLFCDYIEALRRSGGITDKQANSITL